MTELIDTINHLTMVGQSVMVYALYVVAVIPFMVAGWFAFTSFNIKEAFRDDE